jgi:SAM-dependent methyltransferase
MDINNQTEYWNTVANQKEFTQLLNPDFLEKYFSIDGNILDYGCGYGRTVNQLMQLGYKNIIGYDTSKELIKRGTVSSSLPIYHINIPIELPIEDNSVDAILLFEVLTCIPSNKGQCELINLLRSKLKPKGILYISDYYLQNNSTEIERYEYLNNDKTNYGVFTLKEGVTFRHHTKEWIAKLLKTFSIVEKKQIEVTTMNGHRAEAFQLIAKR